MIFLIGHTRMEVHVASSACSDMISRLGPGRVRHLETRSLWLTAIYSSTEGNRDKSKCTSYSADLGAKGHPGNRLRRLLVLSMDGAEDPIPTRTGVFERVSLD